MARGTWAIFSVIGVRGETRWLDSVRRINALQHVPSLCHNHSVSWISRDVSQGTACKTIHCPKDNLFLPIRDGCDQHLSVLIIFSSQQTYSPAGSGWSFHPYHRLCRTSPEPPWALLTWGRWSCPGQWRSELPPPRCARSPGPHCRWGSRTLFGGCSPSPRWLSDRLLLARATW